MMPVNACPRVKTVGSLILRIGHRMISGGQYRDNIFVMNRNVGA